MRNLIPHFIAEKFHNNQTGGNFIASTMFLDISGFTAMTERLMQEGKEGAEILSEIINNIFEPVIETVYNANGFIASFAGDAFTAIFPTIKQSAQVALCAVDIGWIFRKKGTIQTKFGEFNIFVKIGLSSGEVDWAIIGNQKQQTYYFKGEAIDGCAQSQQRCGKSDILFDEKFYNIMPKNIRTPKVCLYNGFYRLINCEYESDQDLTINRNTILPEILVEFIPDQVLALEQQGEFREVVAVFISFKESQNIVELNNTIIETINRCNKFGGYFNRVLFGDKGGMMLICFGMPKSYENNLVRALDFALDIQKQMGDTVRIGINSGVAYAGFIGSSISSEYTAYGDIVNQAARFMARADWGKIWTSESTSSKAAKLYSFNNLDKKQFKGKSAPITIFELNARAEKSETAFFSGEMVGRKDELAYLADFAKTLSENRFAGIITVYAEAGMGKSRLVYEFVKAKHGAEVLFLQTDSVLRMSLNPFKYLLHNYFNQNKAVNKEQKKANFEAVFALLLMILNNLPDERKLSIVKELGRAKSILAAQVEVFYENSLHEQLDAKGRFENTLFAYKEFFKALSLFKPVIIQIEDIHWLDDDSHKMVQTLCRAVDDFPILIVATSRFNDDGSKPVIKVDKEVVQSEIVLDKLDTESGKYFMELQLEKSADAELISFVCNKAEYNPFYIEQIVCYLKDNNLLVEKDGKCFLTKQEIAIPNSISAIIIARIDRLEYDVKNLLQMASVFGREVELKTFLIMIELYQLKVEQSQLRSMLEKIEDEQLWNKFAEIKYIFKHALLNEAAYEMQLKSRLRDLHKLAAQSLEKLYINEEEKFYEIARHYDKAEMVEEAINYYEKAGDWLKKNYQNEKAIECYDRVLSFLDEEKDAEKWLEICRSKADILHVIGRWDEKIILLNKCLELSAKNKMDLQLANFNNYMAMAIQLQGDQNTALQFALKAKDISLNINDKSKLRFILNTIGIIYYNLTEYDKALDNYKLAESLCKEIDDKKTLSSVLGNIGLIHTRLANYTESSEYYSMQKNILSEINDQKELANNLCNTGLTYYFQNEFDKAIECWESSKSICEKIGFKNVLCILLGNIGLVKNNRRDYLIAMNYFEEQEKISIEIGNIDSLAKAYCNIGMVHWNCGKYDLAMEYYKKYNSISEKNGIKLDLAISFSNIAGVYKVKKDYENSVLYYDKAVQLTKQLKLKYYLSEFLYYEADLFFLMEDFNKAGLLINESQMVAKEIERKDVIFLSTILSNKLLALENPSEAVANLNRMLEAETEESNLATIHYEIYKINQSTEHGQKSLAIYQELFSKTPNIEYKNRIDELTGVYHA